MSSRKLIVGALILGGVFASGLAQARGDVQWSVTIGTPIGVPIYSQAYPIYSQAYPVYTQPVPVYTRPAPVVVHRPYHYGLRHRVAPIAWDRDRDGIPNRYDRVYNPRWDRDGDGIPNRHDRVYNPRWDRDGDGIPNRHDRHDNRGGRH
jgi:hypothetical protein